MKRRKESEKEEEELRARVEPRLLAAEAEGTQNALVGRAVLAVAEYAWTSVTSSPDRTGPLEIDSGLLSGPAGSKIDVRVTGDGGGPNPKITQCSLFFIYLNNNMNSPLNLTLYAR